MTKTNNTNNKKEDKKPQGYPVKLFVYDLSGGLAKAYSQSFLGTSIDGIWHTCKYFKN